jgi:hypothetical protein
MRKNQSYRKEKNIKTVNYVIANFLLKT